MTNSPGGPVTSGAANAPGTPEAGRPPHGARKDARRVAVHVSGPGLDAPRVVPADEPLLLADDLAAVRGDGVFDSLLLHRGVALKPLRHLARIARSASMLEIEAPGERTWTEGIELAEKAWVAAHAPSAAAEVPDALLRLVLSRGAEHDGGAAEDATAYITVAAASPNLPVVRREGIAVQVQQRGFSVDLAANAPWQLLGAKTLSYATNMASLRHAARHGFDDVLYLSSEGEVLEGPRSTIVAVREGALLSPPADIGILEGTTLGALAALAARKGIPVRREHLLVSDLLAADSVWFLSSITLASRVRRIDAHEIGERDPGLDVGALVAEAVGFRGWPGGA